MQQLPTQSARISGSPLAQSGVFAGVSRVWERLRASIKPDSLIPSRTAVFVSQYISAQSPPNSAACTISVSNPNCPNVIASSSELSKPDCTRRAANSTQWLSIAKFLEKDPLAALGLEGGWDTSVGGGREAEGRAAAGVPELVTPPSNTGVNEFQPVARGSL
jgi:hypothetical protein